MLEKTVEQNFKKHIEKQGGLCWKWVSPGTKGVPDRIVLLPGGKIIFAELKAPGCKLSPIQEKRKRQIEALGFEYRVVDSNDFQTT